MTNNTETKELKNILNSIEKWINKHNGNVQFIGSFMAFKGKEFEIFDDRLIAYGVKDALRIDLQELDRLVEEEKGDFVNW